MNKEKVTSSEELGEIAEETDENDRRDFLKTAATAAGAMAAFSILGAFMGDEAAAQGGDEADEGNEGEDAQMRPVPEMVRNMKLNIATRRDSRELSFSGRGLGEALQAHGLIPPDIVNPSKASVHIFLKW